MTIATPRNVVHLIACLNTGGTEQQLVELLRNLDPSRWRSQVAVFHRRGALLEEVAALGIDPVEFSLGGSMARVHTLAVIARFAAWLVRSGADVLHCHDAFSCMIGVPAARVASLPVLASRRDLAHHLTGTQRAALRLALGSAQLVLANAWAVAAQAEREDFVPASRLVVVPNGLDLARFDSRAAQPPSPAVFPDDGRPTVLKVGRFTHPAKGHDDFLYAAARVRRLVPAARFVLVGDGVRDGELRRLCTSLGLDDVVTFAGKRHDVPSLLARATLVCHAAHAEGLPNAIMEAMAARRAVVATAVGGVPDLIVHGVTGLLVPPRAPDVLADALVELLDAPNRRAAMGAAARLRVEREYKVERLVERMDRVYTSLTTPTRPLLLSEGAPGALS